MTHFLRMLVATLPALLAACAGPGTAMAPASGAGNALALEGPPYGDDPVELLFDGKDSGRCDWRLVARYPKDTAPHGIDIHSPLRAGLTATNTHFTTEANTQFNTHSHRI